MAGTKFAVIVFAAYYKPSSDSYNFVAMASPTPNAANSGPRVGPIVISEIMYHPAGNGDSEYIELLNVSNVSVTLFDSVKAKAWRLSDGIDFEFPSVTQVTMLPGERIILTKNIPQFTAAYGSLVPAGTKVYEWLTGGSANGGESVRQDRVNFEDLAPWPTSPDGHGPSLTKLSEKDYGNDYINWMAASASPGTAALSNRFATWAASHSVSGIRMATAIQTSWNMPWGRTLNWRPQRNRCHIRSMQVSLWRLSK